jgi:hypothetical protein
MKRIRQVWASLIYVVWRFREGLRDYTGEVRSHFNTNPSTNIRSSDMSSVLTSNMDVLHGWQVGFLSLAINVVLASPDNWREVLREEYSMSVTSQEATALQNLSLIAQNLMVVE